MRYPPEQKERTRARVLGASARLAKRKGFAAASVDELMAAAGMTGGAFYAHFDSKDALFAELITRELARTASLLSPRQGDDREQWLEHLFGAYLTQRHVQGAGSGCVIPALGPEIARANPRVRRAFETAMSALQEDWAQRLGDSDAAWSMICQLVGAIVVARAMGSPAAAGRVIEANRTQIARTAAAVEGSGRTQRRGRKR